MDSFQSVISLCCFFVLKVIGHFINMVCTFSYFPTKKRGEKKKKTHTTHIITGIQRDNTRSVVP